MSDDPKEPHPSTLMHIDGVAYDVTAWAQKHPGGEVLRRFLGADASAVFAAFHSPRARKMLRVFRARSVPREVPTPAADDPVERGFLELRARAESAGRFVASHGFFVRHALWSVGLIGACVAVLRWAPSLWALAALALGLAWQQAGWLSHDVLHHSVFADRRRGDRWGAAFGGIVLGFSGDWWKRKHNVHHALPNVVGEDPDIDVLPLLAFHEHDLARSGAFTRFAVRIQPWTVLPILALARVNWAAQGLLWALFARGVKKRAWEISSILLHYVWSAALLALLPTWGTRIAFYVIAQLASGLMTGSVFLVGHNARSMLQRAETPGFHALQVMTTQNIRAHWSYRWFFGGLERQIEHHLFPTMPRHHHGSVAPDVRALCAQHGLPYTERSFFQGLGDVFAVMVRVARATRLSAQLSPEVARS